MLLELENVEAAYGQSRVLFGLSMNVGASEGVAVMGRNGMGKTTTMLAITGLNAPRGGLIRFAGERIDGLAPLRIARLGVALAPAGRRIFRNLTVRENLVMAAADRRGERDPWTLDRVLAFFPGLAERTSHGGGQLSGGEQQMLAIGRALMTNPRLLILDEATEGLAPIIRQDIWGRLRALREAGLAMIVIDKEVDSVEGLIDRHFIVEKGVVVWSGDAETLRSNSGVRDRYLVL